MTDPVAGLAAAHPGRVLVVFDGTCGLCDRTVSFLAARDRKDRLRFTPLGGPVADAVLAACGADPSRRDTVFAVALDGASPPRAAERSRAVLLALSRLGFPWPLLGAARVLPASWLDAAYRAVADRRRRLAPPSCRVPAPAERAKFI